MKELKNTEYDSSTTADGVYEIRNDERTNLIVADCFMYMRAIRAIRSCAYDLHNMTKLAKGIFQILEQSILIR